MNPRPTLLLVDDVPSNIQLLHDVLKESYELYFATSGAQALELAAQRRPDLILLDVMMPEMDGYEVCRRLKQSPDTRALPVVFITALGEEEDETRGLALGAVDYLTKPINPAIVKARVSNHLALKRARDELEEQNRELEEAAKLRDEVERITRHDLKGPLSGIIGFSDLLLESRVDAEERKTIAQAINDAGYRMLEMINRSLDLFKMETGRYRCDPAEVPLRALLERVIHEWRRTLARRRLDFQLEGEATAWGEELLLYSLFGNLVGNAAEASAPGGRIVITLAEQAQADQIQACRITVWNAEAVPAAIRERFFEKYVTAGKQGGTGIGTYSARLIARAHGGETALESSDEAGTTVTITLPRPPAD